MKTSRRNFVTGTALALGGAGALGLGALGARADVKPPSTAAAGDATTATEAITETTLAEAEKLAGVTYTRAERAQLLRTVGDLLRDAHGYNGLHFANGRAPATVFDPRLPGRTVPDQVDKLVVSTLKDRPLPDSDREIAFAPVTRLSQWIHRRQITAVRLTEIYLERLRRFGPRLNCVVTLTAERALAKARQCDDDLARGHDRGPLHGIPWGAKDLLDSAGIATTWGAEPYRQRVPESDAEVVRRLDQAGAVLVAKLALGALALDDIWFGGKTLNPWNLAEGASGSSAGPGAATAAGLVGFAIGSETLGSIIAPAMRNGVTGLRPTFGRVARTGAMALSWSLDKLGPMTRRVEDAGLVLAAINGRHDGDPGSIAMPFHFDAGEGVAGARVGYAKSWFEGPGVTRIDRAALDAVATAGMELVEIEDLPDLPYNALLTIIFAESAAAFEELTRSGRDDLLVRQDDSGWPNNFRQSRFLSAIDLLQAERLRRQVMEIMDDRLRGVDALISPSFAETLLVVTNYTGHPSLTLRAGMTRRPTRENSDDPGPDPAPGDPGPMFDQPHGITLWGRLYGEGRLLNMGMALESQFGVWDRRPPNS